MLEIIKVIMITPKQKLSSYNELVLHLSYEKNFQNFLKYFKRAGKGQLMEMKIILVYTFDSCLSLRQLQMFHCSVEQSSYHLLWVFG